MIKVFTLNERNKIELTKKELEDLLNQSFWEGCKNNTYVYTSPSVTPLPYYYGYKITTGDTNRAIISTSSNLTSTFKQDNDRK